jgi:alkanesulfonate monooxygenase SsuD/methylene tetrahydromethanopterin reductase-like flavin-dependent oxidoreductase (luciferase family)
MDPSLRLAIELPPVPQGGASLDPWWEVSAASVRAGAPLVWFTGEAPPDEGGGRAPSCDACTIAAAAATVLDTAMLGVVSGLPLDRHPAVLARDVTALDVVSTGRAAVRLCWTGPGAIDGGPVSHPRGLSEACRYLGEAVAVCRAVLQDEDPVFEGRYLHVAGALNRPPPNRPGGPPIFVDVPSGVAGLARRDAGSAFLLRQAVIAATAIVCPDDPGEIASLRAIVEDAAASLWTRDDPMEVPAVVCRTTFWHATDPVQRAGAQDRVSSRLEEAHTAGAEGVVVRMPSGRRGDAALRVGARDAERIAVDLADYLAPFRD